MNNHVKTIIKIIGIIICLCLLIVISYLTITMNKATQEEKNTQVIITPAEQKVVPQPEKPQPKPAVKKPMTRDENDIPKSDYKVPEIG